MMRGNFNDIYILIMLWNLVQIVQCTPGTPFPACMDQKCALGCKEVPIFMYSHDEKYFSKNIFCFNNDLPAVAMRPYRLTGCPTTYFNSLQNTSGICSIITEDNRTDLLLTTNELVTGLHSFDCLFGESPTGMVSSSALVVNARAPYRDFFVNGVLQDDHNITLQVGDDLSVVARAVSNVSVITPDHDGSKFTCETGFACNKHTRHDVSNRYLNCFLSSPAEISDSGKTLTISVNNMEMKRFVITVLPKPLMSSLSDTEAEPTSTTPNTTVTTPTTTSSTADSDDNLSTSAIIIICIFVLIVLIVIVLGIVVYYMHMKWASNQIKSMHGKRHNEEGRTQQNNYEKSDNCVEKEVFDTFYAKLVKILPLVDNIYNMLVPEGILVPDDIQEINSFPRSDHKASVVLQKINSSLQASKTDSFNRLLKVMDTSLNSDVKGLVNDMRRALLMAVFSLFCPEQLCDEITCRGYYMMKMIPSGNMLRTSLDQGIPLIICSCSEYELPREIAELLRTPAMPDNWNILYLHQNNDGNDLQWNERIKVICIDLNNGSPVVEVLNWLSTKLLRRSSTVTIDISDRYSIPVNGE